MQTLFRIFHRAALFRGAEGGSEKRSGGAAIAKRRGNRLEAPEARIPIGFRPPWMRDARTLIALIVSRGPRGGEPQFCSSTHGSNIAHLLLILLFSPSPAPLLSGSTSFPVERTVADQWPIISFVNDRAR